MHKEVVNAFILLIYLERNQTKWREIQRLDSEETREIKLTWWKRGRWKVSWLLQANP